MRGVSRDVIKSYGHSEREIIRNIISLYIPEGAFNLDPTYSKGAIYKDIPKPLLKFDLVPQVKGVKQADARSLPLESETIKSIMFDPPFLVCSSQSSVEDKAKEKYNVDKRGTKSKLKKRFGFYATMQNHLLPMYYHSLREFYRVLEKNGVVVFKCQDTSTSSIQYLTHVEVINMASDVGFYVRDLFLLLAKHRMISPFQTRKNQKMSRKFHAYYVVLQKAKQKMTYGHHCEAVKAIEKTNDPSMRIYKKRVLRRRRI